MFIIWKGGPQKFVDKDDYETPLSGLEYTVHPLFAFY